jgi:hypothetical protein
MRKITLSMKSNLKSIIQSGDITQRQTVVVMYSLTNGHSSVYEHHP